MQDAEFVEFLRWALPRLQLRWAGFRRVRGQVRKRLARKLAERGLADLAAYRRMLLKGEVSWSELDELCRITISRFYRDRGVWQALQRIELPRLRRLARRRGDRELQAWSAGCAGGEEPYTLAMIWRERPPDVGAPGLRLLATDADAAVLERARRGSYGASSLRDLPCGLRRRFFVADGPLERVTAALRESVRFALQDVRGPLPDGPFHLILCRNLIFTYFDEPLQRELLGRLMRRLVPGGTFVVGTHEVLPVEVSPLARGPGPRGVYRQGQRTDAQ